MRKWQCCNAVNRRRLCRHRHYHHLLRRSENFDSLLLIEYNVHKILHKVLQSTERPMMALIKLKQRKCFPVSGRVLRRFAKRLRSSWLQKSMLCRSLNWPTCSTKSWVIYVVYMSPNLQNFVKWTFVILLQFFRMSFVYHLISYRTKSLRKNCERITKNVRMDQRVTRELRRVTRELRRVYETIRNSVVTFS